MKRNVLVDTGPLVALINRREQSHNWVIAQLANIAYPLLTCEAVITEACFLLHHIYGGEAALISLLSSGNLEIPFRLNDEFQAVSQLMTRYQSVPISLGDACLVRMTELSPESGLLTLDSDFLIYRKNRNETISLIIPEE